MEISVFSFFLDLFFPRQNAEYSSIHSYLTETEIQKIASKKITNLNPEIFENLYSFSEFKSSIIGDLIHRAKFNGELDICQSLAEIILNKWQKLEILKADFITFIPADPKRLLQRQYHIPEKIAQILGKKMKVETINLIEKTRHTKSQVELSKEKRLVNLKDVFQVRKELKNNFEESTIWLIDDVFTTGATFIEAGFTIKKAFPKTKIIGLAVAN